MSNRNELKCEQILMIVREIYISCFCSCSTFSLGTHPLSTFSSIILCLDSVLLAVKRKF